MSATVLILIMVAGVVGATFTLIVRGALAGKQADAEVRRLKERRHSAGPVPGLRIAPLAPVDRPAWERHWITYCDFYGVDVPPRTTETTWSRIQDPGAPIQGYGAYDGSGNLLGFAHIVLHPHTWSPKNLCYLEDLFVAQPFRGRDVGHALISYLWAKADTEEWARVYWHTEATNATARRLYDRFRPADGFVRYTLTLTPPSGT